MFNFLALNKIFLYLWSLITLIFVFSRSLNAQDEIDIIDSAFQEIEFDAKYYPKIVKNQLDSLILSIPEDKYLNYRGYVDLINAITLDKDMESDSALHYLESALSFFTFNENKVWLGKCYLHLGELEELSGLYEQAKINFYEVISLYGENKSDDVGLAYLGLGRCKKVLHEDLEDELQMGISILENSDKIEYSLYAQLMSAFFNLQDVETTGKLKFIAKEYQGLNLQNRVVTIYKLIASSFQGQQNYDSAHYYCDKAISLCQESFVADEMIPALYQFKGFLFYNQKMYEKAKLYLLESLGLYDSYNQTSRSKYALNILHQISHKEGDFKTAYKYLIRYQRIVEEQSSEEKIKLAKIMEINNKVDLLKSQLARLKVEKKASVFVLYLIIVIAIVILGSVGVYFYNYQKQKLQTIKELNKEFNNLLIGIGEKQLLEHRLGQKSRKKVAQVFEKSQTPDGDIGQSFDHCYMETINMFTNNFPQLTKTEVRYAVMLCLKLPAEVIAKVQNVQPSSIRKAKQRIRTKLEIADNLEQYLQEFREKQMSNLSK